MLRALVIGLAISLALATSIGVDCTGASTGNPCGQPGVVYPCAIGFIWDPTYGCVQQPNPYPLPPNPTPNCLDCPIQLPGQGPQSSSDCQIDTYWNGEYCIPYTKPDNCTRGRVWNWSTYTCDRPGTVVPITCPGQRYWNGK